MLIRLKQLWRSFESLNTLTPSQLDVRVSEEMGYRILGRMPRYYFVVAAQTPDIRQHLTGMLEQLSARYYVIQNEGDWNHLLHSNAEATKTPRTHPIVIVETGDDRESARNIAALLEQEERAQEVTFYNQCIFIFSENNLPTEADLGIKYDSRSERTRLLSRIWSISMVIKPNIYLFWRHYSGSSLPQKYRKYM